MLSKVIERGLVSPVAISATWYPEATEGLTPFFGVKEAVEQLDAADVDIEKMKAQRAANDTTWETENIGTHCHLPRRMRRTS